MVRITAYLWLLFSVFEVHRAMVLWQQHILYSYRVGFALINALIMAKVILVAEALQVGKRFQEQSLAKGVLLKSALFSLLLLCFNAVEEVVVGLFHGKTIVESMPDLAGGGFSGELMTGALVFVVLIPFFAYAELRRAIGEEQFDALMFQRKAQ